MTNYPEPMNNPFASMADDVRQIMEIRELFERPISMLGVCTYEISTQYMPRLHTAIGDTVSYRDVVRLADKAADHLKEAATAIGEIRLRLEAVAKAVERAGRE